METLLGLIVIIAIGWVLAKSGMLKGLATGIGFSIGMVIAVIVIIICILLFLQDIKINLQFF